MNFLDQDFYNFNQQYGALMTSPKSTAKYKLIIRSNHKFDKLFLEMFDNQLNWYLGQKPWANDVEHLSRLIHSHKYTDFLNKGYRPRDIWIQTCIDDNGLFHLEYSGLWLNTILHEVPLMAMISDLYYKIHDPLPLSGYDKIVGDQWSKCEIPIIEMGTRRRISLEHQEVAIKELKRIGKIKGTSNVYLANKFDLPCFGSVSHQWYMAKGNEKGLEDWLKLGFNRNIALPDTFTTDEFLKVFTEDYARKYDGVRQDSGYPYEFTRKFLNKYEEYGIDPKTKTVVYSDSLNCVRVNDLYSQYRNLVNCEFGVGSNISCIKEKRLNMVIKMVEFDGKKVYKKSDDPNKSTETCG